MKQNDPENETWEIQDPYFRLRQKRNYGFLCKFNSLVDHGYGSRQRKTQTQHSNSEDHRNERKFSDGVESDDHKSTLSDCKEVSRTNINRPKLCKNYCDFDKPHDDQPLEKCTADREPRNIWETQLVAEIRKSSLNGEPVLLDNPFKKAVDHCIWTQTNEELRDSELLHQRQSTMISPVPEYLITDNVDEPVDILSPTIVERKRNTSRFRPYSHHEINGYNLYNRMGIKCFMPNSRKTNMNVFNGSYEELPPLPRLPSFSVGAMLKRCNSDIDVYQNAAASVAHDYSLGPPWISMQKPHTDASAQYSCDKPLHMRYSSEHECLTDRDNQASCVENFTVSYVTKKERPKVKKRRKRRNIRKTSHKDIHHVRFRLVKGTPFSKRIQTKWLHCKYCGDLFRIASDLRSHMKKTHPYRCCRCPLCFPNKEELASHSQSHIQYNCSLCMKKYVHILFYKRHLRSVQHLNLSRIQKETAKMMYDSCLHAVQKGGLPTLSEDLMKIMESSWTGYNDDGLPKSENVKAVNDDKLDSSLHPIIHTSGVCGTSTTADVDATREEPVSTSLESLSSGWVVTSSNIVNGPLDDVYTDKVPDAFSWGSNLLSEWESSVCKENKAVTCMCIDDTEQNQGAPNEGYDLPWCNVGNLSYDFSSSQITNVESTTVTNVIKSNRVSSSENEHICIISNVCTDQTAFEPVLMTTLNRTVDNGFVSKYYAMPNECLYSGDFNTTVRLSSNAGGCCIENILPPSLNILPPSFHTQSHDLHPVDNGVVRGSSNTGGSSAVEDTVTLRKELDVLFDEIEQEVKNSSLFTERR